MAKCPWNKDQRTFWDKNENASISLIVNTMHIDWGVEINTVGDKYVSKNNFVKT